MLGNLKKRSVIIGSLDKNWRSDEYQAFVATHDCLKCGRSPGAITIAPHHEPYGRGGMGCKAPSSHCVPLCWECHSERHQKGVETFWKSVDVKMAMVALLTEYIRRTR